MQIERRVDRSFDAAAQTFAGPVTAWLPVIAGPDSRSWRADTEEGRVLVPVVIEAGAVFVRSERERWRALAMRPDPTGRGAFFTRRLTPVVRGQLGLRESDGGTAELIFLGEPERRSLLTAWPERLLLGNRLAHSALETLLDHIAERLTSPDPESTTGDSSGLVRCAVPDPLK